MKGSYRNSKPMQLTWHALDPLWQAGEAIVQEGLPHTQLAPIWQMLILGDGSLTRHLYLLSGEPIEVEVIDMSSIAMDSDGVPEMIHMVPGPRLRRQTWLCTASGQRLAYVTSWWEANKIEQSLQSHAVPIWTNLTCLRSELYRELRRVICGHSSALESAFGQLGPFWGRYYLVWYNGKPLVLAYEVLSPYLMGYIGSA